MSKILNKELFKKWWFWLIVAVVIVSAFSGSDDSTNIQENTATTSTEEKQKEGTLPTLSSSDYVNKEGLVVFKDLTEKKYYVKASYVNERAAEANQDFTEQFKATDISSCEDRLGWDAYVVSDVKQSGDSVDMIMTNKANSNQECPEGTVNDL